MSKVADQVLPGLAAPLAEDPGEVLLHLRRRRDGLVPLAVDAEDRGGPALQLLVVLAVQSQYAGRHLGRVGEGELPDELGPAPAGEPVEKLAGRRLDQLGLPAPRRAAPKRGGYQ